MRGGWVRKRCLIGWRRHSLGGRKGRGERCDGTLNGKGSFFFYKKKVCRISPHWLQAF